MIRLGNLTIDQMESRSGVEWPAELKEFMGKRHQPEANNIAPGKWHCFDLPFFLACGDMETATTVHGYLLPLAAAFKEQMQIGVQQ